MTLDPLIYAPTVIQIHIASAFIAIAIGPFSIWRKKRDRIHQTLGVVWVASMFVLATSGLFIHEIRLIGPFSPIHLLSFVTYWSLWTAIGHVRAGRFYEHGRAMKTLYFAALVLTGIITLVPGRRMSQILFGSYQEVGSVVVLVFAATAALWLARGRLRAFQKLPHRKP